MKVYLNEISGLWQAIDSLYMSKRSWNRENEERIMSLYSEHFDTFGKATKEQDPVMKQLLDQLFKWSPRHTTLGSFIDFRFTVEGMHRGAQDDFDSHAKRLNNRIVRSSTRMARYGGEERSDWYKGKILTTSEVMRMSGISIPDRFTDEESGQTYVRCENGYVLESLANSNDVLRGLYNLSIPSNFVFACDAMNFAHIVKQRDGHSHAHPELREAVDRMVELVREQIPQLTSEYWHSVEV